MFITRDTCYIDVVAEFDGDFNLNFPRIKTTWS